MTDPLVQAAIAYVKIPEHLITSRQSALYVLERVAEQRLLAAFTAGASTFGGASYTWEAAVEAFRAYRDEQASCDHSWMAELSPKDWIGVPRPYCVKCNDTGRTS